MICVFGNTSHEWGEDCTMVRAYSDASARSCRRLVSGNTLLYHRSSTTTSPTRFWTTDPSTSTSTAVSFTESIRGGPTRSRSIALLLTQIVVGSLALVYIQSFLNPQGPYHVTPERYLETHHHKHNHNHFHIQSTQFQQNKIYSISTSLSSHHATTSARARRKRISRR
jgi:hypothetical protein